LTCKKQLHKVINKIYKAFWTCRDTFRKTWGLKPKVISWIYIATVRPIVTYTASVWWPRAKLKTSHAELSKLQRMACLGITGAMRSAPTAAMEVLLGFPPLHLQVEVEAKVLLSNDQWQPKSEGFGHKYRTQVMKENHVYGKPFTIRFPDIREWKRGFSPRERGK
jgi:hypothetical protein